MVFFNYATMQMAAKIVYYGPGLCGKTTNLHHIYAKTSPQSRGEMVSLETESDRTLFFDLLPIDVGVIGGFKTRLQLYTIPGQVFYNTTRKLVLKGVDGIVFVADSQLAMIDANMDSFRNLRENLQEIGLQLDEIPLVLQLNKRDLPNVASVDSLLDALDSERKYEHVEAVAATGAGVFETLKLISKLTLRTLRRRMTGEEPPKPAPRKTLSDMVQFKVKDEERSQPSAGPAAQAVGSSGGASIHNFPTPPAAAAAASAAPAPAAREVATGTIEAEPEAAPAPAAQMTTPERSPEPEVEIPQTEKPKAPPVKTVKVRSTIDVMAELEALRKKATTQTSTKSKKEPAAPRPAGREVHKALSMHVPADTLAQAKSMKVTVSLEGGEGPHEQSQTVELEPNTGSVALNLRIDPS